jgi:hypothetical protein
MENKGRKTDRLKGTMKERTNERKKEERKKERKKEKKKYLLIQSVKLRNLRTDNKNSLLGNVTCEMLTSS